MPLHDIHFEDHGTETGYRASFINRGTCNYLLFIHELLFSFYGGASEHTLKSPVQTVYEKLDQYKGLEYPVVPSLAAGDVRTKIESFSIEQHSIGHIRAKRISPEERRGYCYLSSGLSPPYF